MIWVACKDEGAEGERLATRTEATVPTRTYRDRARRLWGWVNAGNCPTDRKLEHAAHLWLSMTLGQEHIALRVLRATRREPLPYDAPDAEDGSDHFLAPRPDEDEGGWRWKLALDRAAEAEALAWLARVGG